ncbi:MAG: VOC family protein [Deltaproteobacteria bacterium]|nr:VOC family protein [Deltaproteobacteria bacterium]
MTAHLHHVHLFASDLEASLAFFCDLLGGRVVADLPLAGARNVFVALGGERLHLYDQPPRAGGRGAVHHLGIQTDDLETLVARMKARGVVFRKEITDFGPWKYAMATAPDDLLLELSEVDRAQLPPALIGFFANRDG